MNEVYPEKIRSDLFHLFIIFNFIWLFCQYLTIRSVEYCNCYYIVNRSAAKEYSRGPFNLLYETLLLDSWHHVRYAYMGPSVCKGCSQTVLGTIAKFRKATISFVMSVCLSVRPSVRLEQFGSQWTDFHEIWYLRIFLKPVEKMQVLL